MMVSNLQVKCKNDFIVSKANGEEFVALKHGHTYEATDSGDIITINVGSRTLTFNKYNFPSAILGIN